MNLKTRNIFKEKRGVSDVITFIARKWENETDKGTFVDKLSLLQ